MLDRRLGGCLSAHTKDVNVFNSFNYCNLKLEDTRDDLNLIPIRIQNERNMSHLPIAGSFLKRNAKPLKPLASLLDILDADRDVPKASTWIGVAARVALEGGVRFGSVIVG